MSDDATALTPIAAQPPQPSEAVYQALNAALSATARGRWFLSEFARRNRNSESSKMLDAISRIEQAVATRPGAPGNADLELVRNWAFAARADTAKLIEAPERGAALAGALRGTRIIREISSSMRAVGNDPRICNILDMQIEAIEAAHRAEGELPKVVLAAFDWLISQLEDLMPATAAPEAVPLPLSAAASPAAMRSTAPSDPEARIAAVADLAVACATGDPKIETTPLEDEDDEALLEQIALEMAAADKDEMAAEPETMPAPAAIEPEIFTAPPVAISPQAPPPPPVVASPAPADMAGPSLGEALLAKGLVRAPFKPATDPFAALKRLTQAEKIALFT